MAAALTCRICIGAAAQCAGAGGKHREPIQPALQNILSGKKPQSAQQQLSDLVFEVFFDLSTCV